MTVHFIGAGPGDPELITVRGRRLIETCSVCLFAGSLVPKEVISFAPKDAIVVDTAPLDLDEIIQIIANQHSLGKIFREFIQAIPLYMEPYRSKSDALRI